MVSHQFLVNKQETKEHLNGSYLFAPQCLSYYELFIYSSFLIFSLFMKVKLRKRDLAAQGVAKLLFSAIFMITNK